ncbi:MAG TPA: hypothetical protein ENK57_25385 [Polyangiaceae bacterium]|nr:hypothetical protein [Polyangiaceae bacterium]
MPAPSVSFERVPRALLTNLLASAVALVAVLLTSSVHAQGFGPPGGPGGGFGPPGAGLPQQPTGTQPSPGQEGPETHAASGGETPAQLPTEEAQLPEDPNEIPEPLDDLLDSDFDPNVEVGRERETHRRFFGLYYEEQSGDYSFRSTFPPLWLERKQGDDRASLFGLTYFNRRSPSYDADVLFPIFWHIRDEDSYTTVVGPVMHNERPEGHDNWVAPLFFEGSGEDGHEYMHIPPLLTFHTRDARSGFSMAGPLFCKWKGGARCDNRTADEIDMGIAPLYFYGHDDRSEYEIIPPLLHYYSYEEKGDAELDVWGPFWMERDREGGVFNVLPLFWHNYKGDTEAHTTLFPLVHYGWKGPRSYKLITPLFYQQVGEEGEETFATYLYGRHRGRTELDMYTPLVWLYRDPDIDLSRQVIAPFVYHESSPRSDHLAVFPFFGHFKRHHVYEDLWITPFFRHKTSLTGWETDILPFFFSGRENNSTHLVVAPILWDFASPKKRATVVFPFVWRFADREGVSQLVGNTYYSEEKVDGGTDWQFHFFPFFSYGESPKGHWWNVLYGLAGYTREGTFSKMRVGYIPITLSE